MDNTETINNMIDKIISGENNEAKDSFQSLISAKLAAALDAKKQEVAASLYPDSQPSSEEKTDEPEQA